MRIHPDDGPLKVYAFMQQHAELLDTYAEQFEWDTSEARRPIIDQLVKAWYAWGFVGQLSDVFLHVITKDDRRP